MVKLGEIIPEFYAGERSLKPGRQIPFVMDKMIIIYVLSKRMPREGHHIPENHENTKNLEITPSLRPEGTLANAPDEITQSNSIKDMGQLMNV